VAPVIAMISGAIGHTIFARTQAQSPVPDVSVAATDEYRIEFENEYVRVARVKSPPHVTVPMHSHSAPGGVIVTLTDQDSRVTGRDGTSRDIHAKAGQVRWAVSTPGADLSTQSAHTEENLSDKPIELIRIDPKPFSARADVRTTGIVGTWRLIGAEDHLPNGRIAYPFGERPTGSIVYDSTGHVAVQVMSTGRTKWAVFEDASPSTPAYIAYFGTYDLDSTTKTVRHHLQGHLDPKRIGTDNVRTFDVVGDRLTLIEAERPERHVIWERVRGQ
jgi:hypothetical protein